MRGRRRKVEGGRWKWKADIIYERKAERMY